MKTLISTIIFIAASLISFAQINNSERLVNTPDYSNWRYFNLDDTIYVTIVEYTRGGSCGVIVSASVTIARKSNGELLRIITPCNMEDFKPRDSIRVTPQEQYCGAAYFLTKDSDYSKATKQTTFGNIQKIGP